jgi:hypothetical protein
MGTYVWMDGITVPAALKDKALELIKKHDLENVLGIEETTDAGRDVAITVTEGEASYHQASALWSEFMADIAVLLKDEAGQIVNGSDDQETYSAENYIIVGGKVIYMNAAPITVPSDVPAGEKAIRTVPVTVLGLGKGRAIIEGAA